MSLDVQIIGSGDLKSLARQIIAASDEGLGRQMGAALKRASAPVQRSIREEYGELPSRGGYSALFGKSLRFRTGLRAGGRTASFRLTTFADGTRERRDIRTLERGELRHPIYGRRRARWGVTRVRGNFHQRGTDKAVDEGQREIIKVLDEFAAKLIK
jgi:hypothetical protein